jgi:hypothetical protein
MFRRCRSCGSKFLGQVDRHLQCGVRSAECGVRSAECGVRGAECGVGSAPPRAPTLDPGCHRLTREGRYQRVWRHGNAVRRSNRKQTRCWPLRRRRRVIRAQTVRLPVGHSRRRTGTWGVLTDGDRDRRYANVHAVDAVCGEVTTIDADRLPAGPLRPFRESIDPQPTRRRSHPD